MNRRQFLVTSLALGSLVWAQPSGYELFHARFDCPLKLSGPRRLGLEGAALEHQGFEVVMCEIDRPAFAALQDAGQSPLGYAKSTYLGQAQAASAPCNRLFRQGQQTGELYPNAFPRGDRLEVYWLERKDGAGLMVAFRVPKGFAGPQAEAAIKTVCQTLDWRL